MTDPLDFDGLVIATCQAGQANGFYLSENEARAILSAVLPHVLAGPREALAGVKAKLGDRNYQPTYAIQAAQMAEAALARIDKLTEGLSREGETG